MCGSWQAIVQSKPNTGTSNIRRMWRERRESKVGTGWKGIFWVKAIQSSDSSNVYLHSMQGGKMRIKHSKTGLCMHHLDPFVVARACDASKTQLWKWNSTLPINLERPVEPKMVAPHVQVHVHKDQPEPEPDYSDWSKVELRVHECVMNHSYQQLCFGLERGVSAKDIIFKYSKQFRWFFYYFTLHSSLKSWNQFAPIWLLDTIWHNIIENIPAPIPLIYYIILYFNDYNFHNMCACISLFLNWNPWRLKN